MSDSVELMGAGVRIGPSQVTLADYDDEVAIAVNDEIARVTVFLPPHAARHFAERLILKAAEVERIAAHPADAEPLVPRRRAAPETDSRG